MKIQQKIAMVSAAMLIMINVFPALVVVADDRIAEEISMMPESLAPSEEETRSEEWTTEVQTEEQAEVQTEEQAEVQPEEQAEVQMEEQTEAHAEEAEAEQQLPDIIGETECPVPEEAPPFSASVQLIPQGYSVIGTFTDFPADISIVQPIYSLDGENYQVCDVEWDLHWLGEENEEAQKKLQNQRCVRGNIEPLKSYLEGKLDRFYVKLRLTKENGVSYDTQAAVIDRGEPQPLPEGITPIAKFVSGMLVREMRPIRYYGRYQLTVKENATWEEISAYLPDTLPVEIQLQNGIEHVTEGFVDCPVTWKPASLSELTAGESVVILDAAEEIMVPGGTLLKTPLGIFPLEEAVGMDQYGLTDEVRLVLNVVAEDAEPAGVLAADYTGLKMAFNLKPTGATSIQVYTLRVGDEKWEEHSGIRLLAAVNSQPSTTSSGYALVLESQQEPFRSYQAAQLAGEEPTPFFVGLEIKGGVYDGKQFVLAWPNTYELPLGLPEFGGAGGNEGNAGADNKDDSTQEGQRPDLPHNPQDDIPDVVQAAAAPETEDEPADKDSDIPAVVPEKQECPPPGSETAGNEKAEPVVTVETEGSVETEEGSVEAEEGSVKAEGGSVKAEEGSIKAEEGSAEVEEGDVAMQEQVQGTLPAESEPAVISDSVVSDSNNEIYNKEEKSHSETQMGSFGFLLPVMAVIVIAAGIGIAIAWKYKLHTGS